MIWTVVLWLGMQGWSASNIEWTPVSSYKTMHSVIMPADEPKEGQILGISDEIDAMGKQQLYWKYPDAEHVFEIRTKTEDHGTAKDERGHGLGGTPTCDDPGDVLESPNQCHEGACTSMYIAPHCVRITRELYMDGKRLGTIKGLD